MLKSVVRLRIKVGFEADSQKRHWNWWIDGVEVSSRNIQGS